MSKQAALIPATVTKEALTFPVDYNDVTAADPPSNTTFCSQAQITQFLTVKGTSNFKHLQGVLDALPSVLNHNVTVNLANGIHRPRTGQPGYFAWSADRFLGSNSELAVRGSNPSTWTAEPGLTGLTVDSYQAASQDPWLDFSSSNPGIFTGKQLKGLYVVLSTGQICLIHEHTNDRLYVVNAISPSPVSGTAKIAHPGTILRDSLDDVDPSYYFCMNLSSSSQDSFGSFVNLSNVRVQQPNSNIGVVSGGGQVQLQQIEFDCLTYPLDAYPLACWAIGGLTYVQSCSFLGDASASGPPIYVNDAVVEVSVMYARGFNYGVEALKALFEATAVVLDGVGLNCSLLASGHTILHLYDYGWTGSKLNEIRNSPVGQAAIDLTSIYYQSGLASTLHCVFKNCPGPLFRLRSDVRIDMPNIALGVNLINGGGNGDVGFELLGPGNTLQLVAGANGATGALGDVRTKGGAILSYAQILANGPYVDLGMNVIEKVS